MCRFLSSVKFEVQFLHRFLGRGVCLWLHGVRVAAFFEKKIEQKKIEHLKLLFPGKFQLCFQCTFPSGFFTVAPKIFNKSLKK